MKNLSFKCAFLCLVVASLVTGCGNSSPTSTSGAAYESSGLGTEAEFDEDEALERAVSEISYESYSSVGEPYGCSDDCSGHNAGFEWAKNNEVTDGICGGNSQSFEEGCQAYGDAIQEKVDEYRDDFELGK
jgi:hypothetical protein